MSRIEIMAEATSGSGTEGASPAAGQLPVQGSISPEAQTAAQSAEVKGQAPLVINQQEQVQAQASKMTKEEVVANAKLLDEERLQRAEELLEEKGLLEIPFTEPQKKAILQAHQVGLGEAGIYNYNFSQIREKTRILNEAGFNEKQRRMLLESGIVGALERLKEAVKKKSVFEEAIEVVTDAMKLSEADRKALLAADPDLDELITKSTRITKEILLPKNDEEQEELEQVLYFVRDDIRRIYIEAMQATPKADPDSWYGPPTPKSLEDRVDVVYKALGNYQERFWDYGETTLRSIFGESADIRTLRQKYEGAASYFASRAATAIEKEIKGIEFMPKDTEQGLIGMPAADRKAYIQNLPEDRRIDNLGDLYLLDIKGDLEATKGERERIRREERKRVTADERLHYNNWREKFDFTWAETPAELDDSVEDWLDYFQQQLPLEAEDAVYQEVTKGMANALASLEQARNRIGLEANSVIAQRLRDKIIGHVTTIAGARLLESRDGFEHFIKLRRDFAANYDGHFNVMYLKEGFARAAHALSAKNGRIYKGGPEYLNKPLAGDTKTFRSELEREAIRDSATHELYITKDDIEKAVLGEEKIRREVKGLGLHPDKAEMMVQQRLKERLGRYDWGEDDLIQKLLLEDKRGLGKAEAISADPNDPKRLEAEERRKTRIKLFNKMKDMLDKEDITPEEKAAGETKGLFGLSLEERRARIRRRIEVKMTAEKYSALLTEINAMTDEDARKQGFTTLQAAKDHALWKWVRDYNKPLIEFRQEGSSNEPWFPGAWDMERLSINTPEDLIDRALEEDQFEAMFEETYDPYKGLTDDQIRRKIAAETPRKFEARVREEVIAEMGELEMKGKAFPPGEANRRYQEKMKKLPDVIKEEIGNELFKRKQRETRAVRNYNINIAQDKFLGLQARWGGLTTRVVNENGDDTELRTIYSLAEEIIKAKIDKEEAEVEAKVKEWKLGYAATYAAAHPGLTPAELNAALDAEEAKRRTLFTTKIYKNKTPAKIEEKINEWKLGFVATHPGLTQEQKDEKEIEQRRKFRRNCTFAATLGLREIGIAHDLPIWNYSYYGDVSQIGAFAPLVGYTDDEKGELVELLDRGRREMEAVFNFLAEQHMDGGITKGILVVKDSQGLLIEDENGVQEEAHEEDWRRPRVINEGGVLKLRDLFEARFMISTSGGVKVPDLIAKIADLGVFDELWENGCKDKREWQGFRKRRNKWELRKQSFYNTREWADPITYVQRLAGAAGARKFLVGGEIQGQGTQPGVLNETMKGAWRDRYEFLDPDKWLDTDISTFINKKPSSKEVAAFRKKIREMLGERDKTWKELGIKGKDKLVEVGGDIISFLRLYLAARAYVRNKAGYAPKNWHYDNELIARAYFNELAKRKPVIALPGEELGKTKDGRKVIAEGEEVRSEVEGEALGGQGQAFAIEGRSPVAIKIYEDVLRGSTYEIFDEKDKREAEAKMREAVSKMRQKRAELLKAILPETKQEEIKKIKEELDEQNKEIKKAQAAFATLFTDEEALDEQKINQQRIELKRQTEPLEKLELDVNKTTNQIIEEELDRQISSGDLTNQSLRKQITGRRQKLKELNTTEGNTEKEISRLIDYYINTQLHKQVVGEWPARLAKPEDLKFMEQFLYST